ncbi:YggT family protein [Gammaproteobacteria bacterium]|nr:YggT family protein [Gammaproteobacteria bacterium]|tara:strand:+ start:781 stop:1305 length:525 start_codon:yes stop_codon:yes gene_type:complete
MSTSFEILGLIIGLLNYAFVLLFLFNLLKVDYYNPIVSIFVKAYKPVSKILPLFPNQLINILLLAIILKLLGLYIFVGNQHEIANLIGMAIILTLLTGIRIIFYAVIGGVILSWVSPQNSNPALQLVEEISNKTLSPIRRYIPSAGGLDFSPIFILILVNLLEGFLSDIYWAIQ